jgi:beta-glucosidase
MLGHGLAVQAMRARGPAGTKIGFAENIRVAVPIMDSPKYVEAAEKATRDRNAGFMTVMLEGRYTDAYLAEAGGDSPKFTDAELKTIASPLTSSVSTSTKPAGTSSRQMSRPAIGTF